MEIIILGILTALGLIIIMMKIGVHYFTQFDWQTDLLISGGVAIFFAGTFSGAMVGIIAGLVISAFLTIARFFSQP